MNKATRRPVRRSVAILVLAVLTFAFAQPEGSADDVAAPTADLPVTHVSLYTSGVGYFEHAGTVTGTRDLELSVAAEDMDDLLQSLVLQDLDGGSIRPVRYPARDPLGRILGSYSLDLSGSPSLAQLLAQARGEPVRVEAGETIIGTILAVEREEAAGTPEAPEGRPRTFLTLSTTDGLRRIALHEIRDLRFEREEVREELEAALDALARHRDAEEKTVRLRFEGEGTRRVRIGYVREMPVWKTSYRLLVREDGGADLQGWAIFDNPTDADLVDVSVSFVAGRPLSFVTRLYEPAYVDRPRVDVDTGPTVVPEADAGAFAPPAAALRAPSAPMADGLAEGAVPELQRAEPRLAGAGVDAVAQGAEAGASFEYRISEPVTVGRHESAMIPIVQRAIPAEALAFYDRSLVPLHPLRSVRLVNDTGLELAAGPVTVFGPTGFAGTARLGHLPPEESRLLPYAVDPDLEVRPSTESLPQRVTAVALRNGTIETTVRTRIRTEYRIDGGRDAAFLVIEHPLRAGFEVASPDVPPALARDGYRFGVRVGGGEATEPDAPATEADASAQERDASAPDDAAPVPTHLRCTVDEACTLEVVLERTESRTIAVANVAPEQIAFYLENVELTDEDREALESIVDLQRDIAALDRSVANEQARLDAIHREQDRIRQNMAALDRTSSLYRRYLTDLAAQEDELDGLRATLEAFRAERAALQADLDERVALLGEDAAP